MVMIGFFCTMIAWINQTTGEDIIKQRKNEGKRSEFNGQPLTREAFRKAYNSGRRSFYQRYQGRRCYSY